MTGDINPRYDDPDNYDGTYPPDWDARRSAVYRRDEYTCQECGAKSGPHADDDGVRLDAHHVVPLSTGNSTNELDNLTTLCEQCHNDTHGHDITADDDTEGSSVAATLTPSWAGATLGERGSRRTIRSDPEQGEIEGPSRARQRARTTFEYGFEPAAVGFMLLVVPVYLVGVQTALARTGLTAPTGIPFVVGVGLACVAGLGLLVRPREFAVASLVYVGLAAAYVAIETTRPLVGPLVLGTAVALLGPAVTVTTVEALWRSYKRRTTETI